MMEKQYSLTAHWSEYYVRYKYSEKVTPNQCNIPKHLSNFYSVCHKFSHFREKGELIISIINLPRFCIFLRNCLVDYKANTTMPIINPYKTSYKVTYINKRKSWNEASHHCNLLEGYLPCFSSRGELEEFLAFLRFRHDIPPLEAVYIGLHSKKVCITP